MKVGRCVTTRSEITWFCSADGKSFRTWDPATAEQGAAIKVQRFLAPALPGKIIAVGLNYRDHATELGLALPEDPILFLKPATSVVGPGDTIVFPKQAGRVDYEAELAVVVGKRCKDVRKEDAPGVILGYTCFNDVTARDLQVKDGQWTRAKSFDTFAPTGPWIETALENPHDLGISARLNGQVRQSSNTRNLIFNVFELVTFISSIMTLEPFDIIATGTPAGIGPMERGDEISIEIEGIGTLSNSIA
ncbi:MAG TPA: fumarylacetoacetate hydrolase family protein [Deltaproteobacteria bacterium]|jgi:2-keto-4-pentenoate hydratase/2-oxohepta-3-ene-1,7-dioic acid hydratase in catechol pathway|nr:fumarylacetoacetate hydrolase family protein [Deltaproteobacteria bacterium]OQC28717.1 MAG: Ureidoglycolate lyase [Deltaproteobacteria bacterium ADurb.Bin072]HRW79933.1 fumarylacetoacetate hydrolase family protein [Desulfomonilia bacterium]HNQ86221.1 fumarylacetoacetate hydrolase family protein [Deltaproteobacteria bacterium]HNS90457.1 fumarylacetoacetate hydrolase family protein [Deltaproteobacteria bacterium]